MKKKPLGTKQARSIGGHFGKYEFKGDDKNFEIIDTTNNECVFRIEKNCTSVPDEFKAGLGCLLLASVVSIGSSGGGCTFRNNLTNRLSVPVSTSIYNDGDWIERACLPFFEGSKWEKTTGDVDMKGEPVEFVYDFIMPDDQCVYRTEFYPAESCSAVRFLLTDIASKTELMNLILIGGEGIEGQKNTEIIKGDRAELRFFHSVLVGRGANLNVKYINMDTNKPIMVYPSKTGRPYESIYRSNYRNKEVATIDLVYDSQLFEEVVDNKYVGGFFLPSIEECRYAYQFMSSDVSIYGMEDDYYWTSSFNTNGSSVIYNFKTDAMTLASSDENHRARPFVTYASNGKNYPIGSKGKFNGFVVCMSDDRETVMEMSSSDIHGGILTNVPIIGKAKDGMWSGVENCDMIAMSEGCDDGVALYCKRHEENITEELRPRNGKMLCFNSVNHLKEEIDKAGLFVTGDEAKRVVNKPYLLTKHVNGGAMPDSLLLPVSDTTSSKRIKCSAIVTLGKNETACLTSDNNDFGMILCGKGGLLVLDQYFLTTGNEKFMHSFEYPDKIEFDGNTKFSIGIDYIAGECCYMWINDKSIKVDLSNANEDLAYRLAKLYPIGYIGSKLNKEEAGSIEGVYLQADQDVLVDMQNKLSKINLRMVDEFGNVADVTDGLTGEETIYIVNKSDVVLDNVVVVCEQNSEEHIVDPISNITKVIPFHKYRLSLQFSNGTNIVGFRFFSCPNNVRTITIDACDSDKISMKSTSNDMELALIDSERHIGRGERDTWNRKADADHTHNIKSIEDLERRLSDLEAGNVHATSYVVYENHNIREADDRLTRWFRLWSNGIVEQGGTDCLSMANDSIPVPLPIRMRDSSYFPVISPKMVERSDTTQMGYVSLAYKDKTEEEFYWCASGRVNLQSSVTDIVWRVDGRSSIENPRVGIHEYRQYGDYISPNAKTEYIEIDLPNMIKFGRELELIQFSSEPDCTPARAEIIDMFDGSVKLRVWTNCHKPFDPDVDPKKMPCVLPQQWNIKAVMENR